MLRIFAVACPLILAGIETAGARPAEPGDIGIFFDREGTQTASSIQPFETFTIFVVSVGVSVGQFAYEFLVDMDPRVTFVDESLPSGALDFGQEPLASNRRNFLVGFLPCDFGVETTEVLASIKAVVLGVEADVLFCLEAAEPTSFNPPRPGFLPCCGICELTAYGFAYAGCAVANPVQDQPPVSVEGVSWGALKAGF